MVFPTAAVAALGKEQFVGMYLSAGAVSSFASFLYKVVASQPGLSLGAVSRSNPVPFIFNIVFLLSIFTLFRLF